MKEIIECALNQGLSSLITISTFLLLYKWLDNKKKTESEKFVSSISDTLDEVSKSLLQVSTFITDITKNIIDKDKDKCKNAIKNSFESARMHITEYIVNVIAKNNINDNLDINNQDNPENYKSDSITANVKKKTKSLRKRERPNIKSNRDESDVKDDLAKSDPKISGIVISQEKQVKFDKEQDIAIDRSDLVKNLYQNDDDYENIVDEEYDPSYQKYKDKFDLAQVFIDTGDIDEALEMLLEIKEQADPYLANKAERLIEQYADH